VGVIAKSKDVLDWFGRGQILYQIFAAVGVGTILRALLLIYTRMNPLWVTPVWLASAVGALAVIVLGSKKLNKRLVPQAAGQTAIATTNNNFDATIFFRQSYYSPLQPEAEANIRQAALQNQPNDREGFYVKMIAVGGIAYGYDTIWWTIYKSQLLALSDLNKNNGVLPIAKIKSYYDHAALEFPTQYSDYSFDQWLSYMQVNLLVIRHPSEMVEMTVRGKDFLKYLLHWARDMTQRPL
jgi:hypothetical protein